MDIIDEIIANTKATMAVENTSLSEEDEQVLRDCLSGKTSYEEALATAIAEFKSPSELASAEPVPNEETCHAMILSEAKTLT